jgi:hypothetical protein
MRTLSLLVATLLLTPSLARADSDSLLTVGVGTGFGKISSRAGSASYASDLRLRVRVLKGIGLEATYNPGSVPTPTLDRVSEAKARLSALLFVMPTFPLGGYLKAGVAADSFAHAWNFIGDTVTYHAGGGLEVALGSHLMLGAEFLYLVPQVRAVMGSGQNGGSTQQQPATTTRSPIFDKNNYRATASLMYYL